MFCTWNYEIITGKSELQQCIFTILFLQNNMFLQNVIVFTK